MRKEAVFVSGDSCRVFVESSQSLYDREQEAKVAKRLAKGFSYSPEGAGVLFATASIFARRELRQSHRNWHWFSLEERNVSEGIDEIGFKIALNVRLINDDSWVRYYGFQEGDIAEIIGFYLKLIALREEGKDFKFLGRLLSDYYFKENADELWPHAAGFYAEEVLLSSGEPISKNQAS